jgi:hypothetical protein
MEKENLIWSRWRVLIGAAFYFLLTPGHAFSAPVVIYTITPPSLPTGMGLYNQSGSPVNSSNAPGTIQVRDGNGGRILAEFGLNGSSDLSGMKVNSTLYSVAVNFAGAANVSATHTLMLPVGSYNGIYVCPSAMTIDAVNEACAGKIPFTLTECKAGTTRSGATCTIANEEYSISGLTSTGLGLTNATRGFLWNRTSGSLTAGDNSQASGYASVALGNGLAPGHVATAIGWGPEAWGNASVAMGFAARAIGRAAVALGNQSEARGPNSLAAGYQTNASGTDSIAIGNSNRASGDGSVALGLSNIANGSYSAVGGGSYNTASGSNSVIAGGQSGSATYSGSAVGGGLQSRATGDWAVVAGGNSNSATAVSAVVSGGATNLASGEASVVAGGGATYVIARPNTASGNWSVVSGGSDNTASGNYAIISGGDLNRASGTNSVVSGGESNSASGSYSAIAGGTYVNASGNYALAAGNSNYATGDYSVALGYLTDARDKGSIAIGYYKHPGGPPPSGPAIISAGNGSVAMGLSTSSYGLAAYGDASVAIGRNVIANGTNAVALGSTYANPTANSFTVGFGDITLNVTDNLVNVLGDVNATGRVCDGAGNCLGSAAQAAPYWVDQGSTITSNTSIDSGNVTVSANLYVLGSMKGGGADFAEIFPAAEELSAGEVVCLGTDQKVRKCSVSGQKSVAGVVSKNPTVTGNAGEKGVAVGIVGILDVKAKGPIGYFDLLTTAPGGYAQKASAQDTGAILGKAMEQCNRGECRIKVLVALS